MFLLINSSPSQHYPCTQLSPKSRFQLSCPLDKKQKVIDLAFTNYWTDERQITGLGRARTTFALEIFRLLENICNWNPLKSPNVSGFNRQWLEVLSQTPEAALLRKTGLQTQFLYLVNEKGDKAPPIDGYLRRVYGTDKMRMMDAHFPHSTSILNSQIDEWFQIPHEFTITRGLSSDDLSVLKQEDSISELHCRCNKHSNIDQMSTHLLQSAENLSSLTALYLREALSHSGLELNEISLSWIYNPAINQFRLASAIEPDKLKLKISDEEKWKMASGVLPSNERITVKNGGWYSQGTYWITKPRSTDWTLCFKLLENAGFNPFS